MPCELCIVVLDAVSTSASGFPCRALSFNESFFTQGWLGTSPATSAASIGPAQHASPALQMCQHLEQLTRTIEVGTAPMFQTATATKVPCPALPCPALPCPALPCPALPCPALPCPALPCPALPCPALPCPALPARCP